MLHPESDIEDADVPERALAALAAAYQRSVAAGHPQVVVRHGELVRVTSEGVTVLKKMRGRIQVSSAPRTASP